MTSMATSPTGSIIVNLDNCHSADEEGSSSVMLLEEGHLSPSIFTTMILSHQINGKLAIEEVTMCGIDGYLNQMCYCELR